MTGLESNVFPILNAAELVSFYRLLKIRGLDKDQPEYYQNRQTLIRKLSFARRQPVTIVERDGEPLLVLPAGTPDPPSPFRLVRTAVYFDPIEGEHKLDFMSRDAASEEIARRFLQFLLRGPLADDPRLWTPAAGRPFFQRHGAERVGRLSRYIGFSVNVIATVEAGIALRIDVGHKVVAFDPLPLRMSREDFRRVKGQTFIYHFGHSWFEIHPNALSTLNASEEHFFENGKDWRLIDYIAEKSRKPIPPELASLPHDASVCYYQSNNREQRSAPTGLCYRVFDTNPDEVRRSHGDTLLRPGERRSLIHGFAATYLQGLRFGQFNLKLSDTPFRPPQKMFRVPDLEFGNDRVLSVRGTDHANQISLDRLGRSRMDLLRDTKAGFAVREPLDRQYLFLPQSVQDSFGPAYLVDLTATVNELFPQPGGYKPILVAYNDRGPRTFVQQGKAILEAAEQNCRQPGYALVMIHHTEDRRLRQHDQLAALVTRDLQRFDLKPSVNHSLTPQEAYEHVVPRDGATYYRVRQARESRFRGYLRAVALNKILLNNERWPFILATPTTADVTIGIDVKNNTAGFTVVSNSGRLVRTVLSESSQKEQLLESQVKKYVSEILRQEAREPFVTLSKLVFHRDGRIWPQERSGIRKAIEALKHDGVLPPDVSYSVLEVSKTSIAPVRLFDVSGLNGAGTRVDNPQVGYYWIATEEDGYLCATGNPFSRHGTVRPLHVRFIEGTIPFEFCLEDLYYLTALTWSRPDDCTRYPITIKLNDRRLGDDASEFDRDALEFSDAELTEEVS
jgi:hypothetical protein